MSVDVDVVVVGGGPAGATTAMALKAERSSIQVLLADKARFPRDKVCGDGLGPGVVHVLRSLDATDLLDGAMRPTGAVVGGPGGYEGHAKGPSVKGRDLAGYVLPRRIFDARLLAAARDRGVVVREGTTFLGSELTPSCREVRLRDPAGRETVVRTRFLVGADGAYSKVRRDLGVAKQQKSFTLVSMRGYADVHADSATSDWSTALRFDFEPALLPAYGWLFPVTPQRANVGVMTPVDRMGDQPTGLGELVDSYMAGLGSRGIHLETLTDRRSHQMPHAGQLPRMAVERAALVGDAASMINPLSGEGIGYGMIAGQMLAAELADQLCRPTAPDGSGFERRFRRRFRAHYWSCWTSHRVMRSPRWAGAIVKAAARDDVVMNDAALLLFDEHRLKLGGALRIVLKGR